MDAESESEASDSRMLSQGGDGEDSRMLNQGGFMSIFMARLSPFEKATLGLFRRCALLLCTTHYSGVGMFEQALVHLMGAAEAPLKDGPSLVIYHATDINARCRGALLSSGRCAAPLHVGGDICERIPAELVEAMREQLKTTGAAWEADAATFKRTAA